MGAWGGLVIIDFEKFKNEVVPALKEGEDNKMVRSAINKLHEECYRGLFKPQFENLSEVINTLDDQFMFSTLGKNFVVKEGTLLIANENFQYHPKDYWEYEDLAILFERLFTDTCFEYVGNYGLSFRSLWHLEFDSCENGKHLLNKLHNYNNFWIHASGGFGEGIHGWLDEKETQLFHKTLKNLRIKEEYSNNLKLEAKVEVFKSSIGKAVELKRGVLWGADLQVLFAIYWKNLSKAGNMVRVTSEILEFYNGGYDYKGELEEI